MDSMDIKFALRMHFIEMAEVMTIKARKEFERHGATSTYDFFSDLAVRYSDEADVLGDELFNEIRAEFKEIFKEMGESF